LTDLLPRPALVRENYQRQRIVRITKCIANNAHCITPICTAPRNKVHSHLFARGCRHPGVRCAWQFSSGLPSGTVSRQLYFCSLSACHKRVAGASVSTRARHGVRKVCARLRALASGRQCVRAARFRESQSAGSCGRPGCGRWHLAVFSGRCG